MSPTRRSAIQIIREELDRYRRMYRQATVRHSSAPGVGPDRRERWFGAIGALERVLRRLIGRDNRDE